MLSTLVLAFSSIAFAGGPLGGPGPIDLGGDCPEEGEPLVMKPILGGGLVGDCDPIEIEPEISGEDPAGTTGDDPPALGITFLKSGETSLYVFARYDGESLVYEEAVSDIGSLMSVSGLNAIAVADFNGDGMSDLAVGDPTGLRTGALWFYHNFRKGSVPATAYATSVQGPWSRFGLGAQMALYEDREGYELVIGGYDDNLAVSFDEIDYADGLRAFTSRDVFEFTW